MNHDSSSFYDESGYYAKHGTAVDRLYYDKVQKVTRIPMLFSYFCQNALILCLII
ncbi:MAG: hypothetical protein ACI8QD_001114 [Cyclobacteriaceae bacterium]